MISINKLRKRNPMINDSDDIYSQYIEDYQFYFENALNKTNYEDYYNEKLIGEGIILDVSINNLQNGDEKYITTLPNSKLYIGQVLSLKFEDDIKYWLIIEKEHLAIPSHDKFKMRPCNYILKWMDDGILNEQPCIITNNTKYTGGTKTLASGLTEVDAMVNITIAMNNNTKKISYGKRLFTMKNAWQVTLIDDITTENVFLWTLGKDSINTNDDVVNGICDAFLHNYAISLSSTSESIVETSTYQITPIITDNGILISDANITYKSSDETIVTVDSNGLVTAISVGNAIITASIGNVDVDLALSVTAKTVTPVISYGYSFRKSTSIKQYVTSILTCTKTIDSVATPLNISCSWDSVGQSLISSNKIVITTKSSSSIGIKNALITTSTVAYLTVTDIDTGTKILDNVAITFINGL